MSNTVIKIVLIFLLMGFFSIFRQLIFNKKDISKINYDFNIYFLFCLVYIICSEFFIAIIVHSLLLIVCRKRLKNKPGTLVYILFASPTFTVGLSTFGLTNSELGWSFFYTSVALLCIPIVLSSKRKLTNNARFIGWCLVLALIYDAVIIFGSTTVLDATRTIIYDVLYILPFWAILKSISEKASYVSFRQSIVAIGICASAIAVFEIVYSWYLFAESFESMVGSPRRGGYLMREGLLRSRGIYDHSLVLGAVLMLANVMVLPDVFGRRSGAKKRAGMLSFLITGLLSTLSRGPILSGLIGGLIFSFNQDKKFSKLAVLFAFSAVLGSLVLGGASMSSLLKGLPIVGQVEARNIDFREELVETGIAVAQENILFGNPDYQDHPAFLPLLQHGDLLDMVNVYLYFLVYGGIVGLLLKVVPWYVTLQWVIEKNHLQKNNKFHVEGVALLAANLSFCFLMSTLSWMGHVQLIYVVLLSLNVAYSSLDWRKPDLSDVR